MRYYATSEVSPNLQKNCCLIIQNSGGAVILNDQITNGSGAVTIIAKGDISSTVSGATIEARTTTLQSTAGNIGKTAQIEIDSDVNGATVALSTGLKTGVVNVMDFISSSETLTTASTGASYSFTSNGSLTVAAPITATNVNLSSGNGLTLFGDLGDGTGTVNLQTSGTLTQTAGTILTKTLIFGANSSNNSILTNATTIGSSSLGAGGSINIQDSTTGTLNLQGISQAGIITVATGGGINITGPIGSSSTASTSLLAAATGSITTTGGVNAINGGVVNLSGLSLGAATQALIVNSTLLNVNARGLVNIANNSTTQGALTLGNVGGVSTSFSLTNNGSIDVASINSSGKITISDISTMGTGGITTQGAIVSPMSITLQASNAGDGNLFTIGGSLLAPTVTISNTGAANSSGILLSANVGTSTNSGVVTIDTNGLIDPDTNPGQVQVTAKTFNFQASSIGDNFDNLGVIATAINQTVPGTSGNGIFIIDKSVSPVTISNISSAGNVDLTVSGGGTFGGIQVSSGNSAAINSLNSGNVVLTGNVGDSTLIGTTSIAIGGTGNITANSGVTVSGASVNLSISGTTGNIGTSISPLLISSPSIVIAAPGSVNVSNNVSSNSSVNTVSVSVTQSRSLNLQNTEVTSGTLAINQVEAMSNGGGAITISSNTGITVGVGGVTGVEANGPISISSTGTGAGDVSVAGAISVTSHNGGVSIQSSGTNAALNIGSNTSISSVNGDISLKSASGSVEIEDGASFYAHNFGNISVTASAGEVMSDNSLTATADKGNISFTGATGVNLGDLGSGTTQMTASNGNISLSGTGNSGANAIVGNTVNFSASGLVSVIGTGSVQLGASGTNGVDITSVNSADSSQAGIQIKGNDVTIGATSGGLDTALFTNGSININSTGTTVGITINSNGATSSGPTHELAAVGTGNSGGNVTITAQAAGTTISIADNFSLTAEGNTPHTGIVSVQANGGDGSLGGVLSTIGFGKGDRITYTGGVNLSSSGDMTFLLDNHIAAVPGSVGAVNITSIHGASATFFL
jgi:autotransporter family porin